ncbi:MAG TPA: VTT domain-containing protein [Terriglobia bacterium]|jgi:membrane protein DedA with SNARE-associated domain|nr:VTT domain-containing protein [Terriglobia bacterium]
MGHIIPFLLKHGYAVVFAGVLCEVIGVPISSVPLLLAAGALAGSKHLSLPVLVAWALLACLIADISWYQLGRRRGFSILRLLCRISLEPDSCVRHTEDRFARQGGRALLVAKFVPGLGTAAAPLAGLLRMRPARFLAWDAAGSLLWATSYLAAGYIFSPELDRLGQYAGRLGAGLVILLGAAIAVYVGLKYRERQRFIRDLRVARISADELRQRIASGEEVVVVDLRGSVEFEADPAMVMGAIHMLPEELEQRSREIPRDRDVVLYCT